MKKLAWEALALDVDEGARAKHSLCMLTKKRVVPGPVLVVWADDEELGVALEAALLCERACSRLYFL
jgi:hypothetical protein